MNTPTPVTVVYMFYRQATLDPTYRKPKGPIGSVFDMVRSFRNIDTRAIMFTTGSDIIHVLVGVDAGNGILYCNWNSKRGTQWTNRPPRLTPDYVCTESGEMKDLNLDPIFPKGEKSHWLRILLWVLTGFPKNTMSCSMVVHRIREHMGIKTKARSPGGIYRELKDKDVDQSRPS